ncbi:Endonuclease 4 [subsurface metagenome]
MRLGAHMSVSGGKHLALVRGKEIGCESIQVFIRNVRSWASKPLEQKDIDDFLKKKEEIEEIWPIITHNSYLINLASQDAEKLEKSYNAMLEELKKADQLKLEYANVHPGVIPKANQDLSSKDAMNQITDQLNRLIDATKDSKVTILLETTAGQGKGLGHKFEHMKYMIDRIEDKKRIGVCFDTAHSFAAGYDYDKKEI